VIVQSKWKGHEKLVFSTDISFISKTIQDRSLVTMEENRNSYAIYWMVQFSIT